MSSRHTQRVSGFSVSSIEVEASCNDDLPRYTADENFKNYYAKSNLISTDELFQKYFLHSNSVNISLRFLKYFYPFVSCDDNTYLQWLLNMYMTALNSSVYKSIEYVQSAGIIENKHLLSFSYRISLLRCLTSSGGRLKCIVGICSSRTSE
jgi:hypothetical protein